MYQFNWIMFFQKKKGVIVQCYIIYYSYKLLISVSVQVKKRINSDKAQFQ